MFRTFNESMTEVKKMHNQYLDVFLEEATEHIDNLNKYLLELESNPAQEIVDEIFRSAHTLKVCQVPWVISSFQN